jgi:hypothetical protein
MGQMVDGRVNRQREKAVRVRDDGGRGAVESVSAGKGARQLRATTRDGVGDSSEAREAGVTPIRR